MSNEEKLMALIEANTRALEMVADAIKDNAAKNEKLSRKMDLLTGTIAGAQRKIGGELGPIIEQSRNAARKLHESAEEAVRLRDKARGDITVRPGVADGKS